MSFLLRSFLLLGIILALDWYFFHAVSHSIRSLSPGKRSFITWLYWSLTALTLVLLLLPLVYPYQYWSQFIRVYLVSFVLIIGISKLVGSLFLLVDDVLRIGEWAWLKITAWRGAPHLAQGLPPITRKQFLTNLALVAAALPFSSFLYGMVRGAFNYKVHRVNIKLPNLPKAFEGFKIVQISDIHIGSFVSSEPLERAFELVNAQKPDVIFFTGDLVNNLSSEVDPHLETLKKLRAEHGIFSTIGNHDYGDYVQWESKEAKRENFERLKHLHREAGWRLLMNEHHIIEREESHLAVIGIENWGAAMNFPKRGDLAKAHAGTEKANVKLLLSHDPSHWEAQVRKQFPDVDVMFSGHTHGAQFGVEIPGFRWSPVQYFYKQWAGLYQQGKQYLYVNRGLGFLGYPGRVGISPEITVVELSRT
ncbi:MAG: metallophosphoesterase [Candidatus Kapabacteria bacterium]|nr:metallophosphoesterase [Candidatus Kapabacteria bacterium]